MHFLTPYVGEVIQDWHTEVWGYDIFKFNTNKLLYSCSYPREIPNSLWYSLVQSFHLSEDYRVLEIYIW